MMQWLAAGVGAGFLSSMGARSAQAANGDPVLAGQTVDATAPTRIRNNVSTTPDSTADGVQGYATGANNSGLFGRNNVTDGIGVSGAAPSGTGVFGESVNGFGVGGRSTSGTGIRGESTSGVGIRGESTSGMGVRADSTSSFGVYTHSVNGYAIWAESDNAIGFVGKSITNHGGLFEGGSAGGTAGVLAYGGSGGIGVFGQGSAYAGQFQGNVYVNGSLIVTGGKSAAVPHPDGTLRRVYCVESPQSYFEDVGQAQLVGGRAAVRLDPDFAAIVRTTNYYVFITPGGDCRGLYVASQSPTGFEVRELQGGSSTLSFSYRVMAERKDISLPRLDRGIPPPPIERPTSPQGTNTPPSGTATPPSPAPSTPTRSATSTPAPATISPATATPAPSLTPTPTTTSTPTTLPTRTSLPGAPGSPTAT